MVTEAQLLYLYLCKLEKQCIAVGPRNVHFVSIHQVSSGVDTLQCSICGQCCMSRRCCCHWCCIR